MIFSATDDGSRASIQTDDPASRRCAPDSRLVSAPNIGLAHPALALLLLAGLAAPVQAATFVSNIGQTDAGFVLTTLEQDVSQGFTTGSSGAILTSIEIKMDTSFGVVTDVPTVTLHKDSATSAAVATLTGPSSIAHADANYTFTAPADTALDASTTYYVVLEGGPQSGLLRGRITSSDNEDSGGRTGWSVANGSGFRTGSSTGAFTANASQALMIRVNGTTRTVTVPSAPQNLEATEGDGLVRLNWSAPANNGGAVITGYEYRHAAGTTVPDATDWTAVADSNDTGSSAGDETSVLVRGLTNATAYAFEMRAVNSAGGGTAAGPVTATPAAVACAMPDFDTRRNIWTGNMTVGTIYATPASSIYGFRRAFGSLDDKDFTIGQVHEIDAVVLSTAVGVRPELQISLKDGPLTSSEKAALRLHVCDAAFDFSAADGPTRRGHTYHGLDNGLDWSLVSTRTLHLSLPANTAATGVPAISGTTTTVGSMLTADKGTIADADGVPAESTFTYQWIRVDGSNETDISGATSSTYTLVAADDGKEFKVKVSFTDDLGSEEERISGRFPPPPPPSVSIAAVYPTALIRVANPEFRVTIAEAQTSAVTVNISIDQDAGYLSSTTQSIEIAANETSATGKFLGFYGGTTSGDLTATVVAGTGYVPAATPANAATVSVLAPGLGNVLSYQWADAAYSVDEGDGVEIVVTLRTAAGVPKPRESFSAAAFTTVELTGATDMATGSTGGSQGAPGDYTAGGKVSLHAPADWSADGAVFTATSTFTVQTTEDSAYEGNERFKITLSTSSGALGSPGSPSETIVTIVDDETLEVTGVAVSSTPSSGSTYGAGETISFKATFSAKVTVTGTPQFAFSLGGVSKQAAYASGSDSTEPVFSYTVAARDNDADGVSWSANALSLNGGTIKFMTSVVANRVDAALTHAAGDAQSGHKVDTAPVLSSAIVNGSALTLIFGEALDTASEPGSSAFTVKVGGTAVSLASSNPVAVSGSMVTLTLAAAVTDAQTVTVSYAVPTSNPLQDAGGTKAAAFSDQAVTNRTGNSAPFFANATEARNFPETEGSATVATAGDVGAVVMAMDTDPLTYTLEGTDAAAFSIDASSGQIRTRVGRRYDREAKASYAVTVRASDAMDSDTVAVTITVTDVVEKPLEPEAPSVSPTPGDTTGLTVSWTAPDNAGRPGITGYKVQYRAGTGGAWMDHSHAGTVTTASIANLAEDTSYEVRVRAANADGDGAWSEAGTGSTSIAEPTEPGAPRNLEAAEGDTQVTLSWAAPSSTGGSAIARYRYRYAARTTVPSNTAWIDVPDSDDAGASTADERGVTVTGLVNETQYAFEVQAVNGVGEGPAASVSATPAMNPDLPSQVIDLRAVVGDGTVTLTWVQPVRTGSHGSIDYYEYRYAAGSSVPTSTSWASADAGRHPFTQITGLENGRSYAFEVRAVNKHGYKGPVVTLTARPYARVVQTLPTAPRGLRGDGSLYAEGTRLNPAVTERAQVKLSWDAPSNLGNSLLVRYEYRYAARGESLSSAAWNHGPASGRTLTVRNLVVGTTYTFQLRAVTDVGAGRAASVGVTTPRSERLSLSVFTRGAAVEGENLTIGVRRSGRPASGEEVLLAVVEIYDSTLSSYTHQSVDIASGAREGTATFRVPFDGERGASRELEVTLNPGSWVLDRVPEGVNPTTYRVGSPSRATVRVSNRDALLRVRDATVREGPQAQLRFDVSLDRAAAGRVTVDYATSDVTATAGADYTATSSTLSFAAGEISKTVSVAVLDDAHDEGTETLTLTLSNARGAAIDDGTATGRIINTDPMPKAWLARFGRTASDHVIQAIESRLHTGASAQTQSHLTIGGRRVDSLFERGRYGAAIDALTDTPDPRLEPETAGARMDRLKAEALGLADGSAADSGPADGDRAGSSPEGSSLLGGGPADGGSAPRSGPAGGSYAGSGAGRRLAGLLGLPDLDRGLMGSSFLYSRPADGGDAPAWLGRWTAWGQTAETRFDGADGPLSVHGEVATATVGVDTRRDRWLAGVAVSYSLGDGAYTQAQAGGGTLASTLASVSPFARFELNERTSLWGVFGHGAGRLSLRPDRAEAAMETDLTNTMTAFGARTALSALAGRAGRFELSLVSDARLTSTASDTVAGLMGATGETSRVRVLLQGAGSMPLATGGALTPTLEAGLRYDGGDAETGAGVEIGAGLGYTAGRFAVQMNVRGLVAHEDADYEEWGFSGAILYRAADDGRGVSFDLGSVWGAAQSGVEGLWNRQNASGLARGVAPDAAQRLQANLGYGVQGRKGRALWVPYVGADGGDGNQALRLGVKLSSGPNLEAGLEFGRRDGGIRAAGQAPERAMQLRWGLRW